MWCWSHYKFRQRLIAKSEFFSDCKVIKCDESYTCKSCGYYGVINDKLGVIKCLNANKKIVNKSLLVVSTIFMQLESFCGDI